MKCRGLCIDLSTVQSKSEILYDLQYRMDQMNIIVG